MCGLVRHGFGNFAMPQYSTCFNLGTKQNFCSLLVMPTSERDTISEDKDFGDSMPDPSSNDSIMSDMVY